MGYKLPNQSLADISEVANLMARNLKVDSPEPSIRSSSPAMTMDSEVLSNNNRSYHPRINAPVVIPPKAPSPPLVFIEPPGPRKQKSHRSDDWTMRAKRSSSTSESSGSQRSSQSLSQNTRRLIIYNPDEADDTTRKRKDKQPEKTQPPSYKYEPPPLPELKAPYSNHLAPLAPNRYPGPPPQPGRTGYTGIQNKTTVPSQGYLSAPSFSSRVLSGKPFSTGNDDDTFSDTDSTISTTSSTWKKPPTDIVMSRKKSTRQVQDSPQPLHIQTARSSQRFLGDTRPGVKEVLTHLESFFPSHNLDAVVESPLDEDTAQTNSNVDATPHKYIMKSVKTIAEEQIGSPIRRRQTRLWDSRPEEIKAPK